MKIKKNGAKYNEERVRQTNKEIDQKKTERQTVSQTKIVNCEHNCQLKSRGLWRIFYVCGVGRYGFGRAAEEPQQDEDDALRFLSNGSGTDRYYMSKK